MIFYIRKKLFKFTNSSFNHFNLTSKSNDFNLLSLLFLLLEILILCKNFIRLIRFLIRQVKSINCSNEICFSVFLIKPWALRVSQNLISAHFNIWFTINIILLFILVLKHVSYQWFLFFRAIFTQILVCFYCFVELFNLSVLIPVIKKPI